MKIRYEHQADAVPRRCRRRVNALVSMVTEWMAAYLRPRGAVFVTAMSRIALRAMCYLSAASVWPWIKVETALMMGRPLKLTRDVMKTLESVFSRGQTSVRTACAAAGIAPATFYAWMSRGEAGDPEFVEFSDAIKRARAAAVQHYLDTIHHAAKCGTWQAAAWWLERVLPYEYGRKVAVETISADVLDREIQRLEAEVDKTQL